MEINETEDSTENVLSRMENSLNALEQMSLVPSILQINLLMASQIFKNVLKNYGKAHSRIRN